MTYTIVNINNIQLDRIEEIIVRSNNVAHFNIIELLITVDDNSIEKRVLSTAYESNVVIDYGTDDKNKKIDASLLRMEHLQNNKILVTLVTSGVKLDNSYITESYNNENAVAMIKRLVSQAGFNDIDIDIPDITIPHILFNNITTSKAIENIVATIKDQTASSKILYWVDDNKFIMRQKPSTVTPSYSISSGKDIIKHSHSELELSYIEIALNVAIKHSDHIDINDARKDIVGKKYLTGVTHSIKKGVGRSYLFYEN